jgi:transketolase C-terminal domain/subunit
VTPRIIRAGTPERNAITAAAGIADGGAAPSVEGYAAGTADGAMIAKRIIRVAKLTRVNSARTWF